MNRITRHAWRVAVWLALAAAAQAQAATDPLQVRSWAAGCSNCHGTNGMAKPGNEALAGMNREEMEKKLLDFRAGRKPATIMHQLTKGYTEEQLQAIAAYYAAQKK
jgi:cytochrome subunit of sulfide dehydrogenase